MDAFDNAQAAAKAEEARKAAETQPESGWNVGEIVAESADAVVQVAIEVAVTAIGSIFE